MGNIFESEGLISFQEMCDRFDLPRTSFFLYLQLRTALRAYGVPWGTELPVHPVVSWVVTPSTRGLVSAIYSQLQHLTQKDLPVIKTWAKDLAVEEEDIDWERVWENIFHSSKNPNHQLIHFKMCQRAYHTPLARFRMKHAVSPDCDLCSLNVAGTFKHMVWECPEVYDFWAKVTSVMSDMIGKPVPLEPIPLLLNDDSHMGLNARQRKIWLAGLTAAKKLVVQRWIPPHKLYTKKWLEYFLDVKMLELSTARVNGAKAATLEVWREAAFGVKGLLGR